MSATINFVFGSSALGQAAQGTDFIRGQIFYGTAPGSFGATPNQAVFSLADAVAKGIANDYADETAPRSIVTLTGSPTVGDTLALIVTEPDANSTSTAINLGTGVAPATPTVTTFAAAIVAAINANTYTTGYTANNSAGVITIIGRKGLGISLNTGTPLAITVVGTTVGTITQQFGTGSGGATAGVFSNKSLWYYHVSEFFRENPTGVLWVNFTATPNVGGAYTEITTLQSASQGACKAIGIYNTTARTAAQVVSDMALMNAQAVSLVTLYMPAQIFYAPNIAAITDLSTLLNGQAYTYQYCTPNIGQDGAAAGADLFVRTGVSVTTIGNMLGVSSACAVSQDIGENINNISNGTELNIPAFSNGKLYSSIAGNLITQLDSYHYVFPVVYTNYSGTYYNDDWTFTANTSDYNRISRGLTMQKAIRLLYAALLPVLKSRVYLKKDGTMTVVTQNKYLIPGNTAVGQMQKDGDISNWSLTLPSQNVLSTGKVVMTLNIQPVGIAETIEVDLAFAQTI